MEVNSCGLTQVLAQHLPGLSEENHTNLMIVGALAEI